MEIKTNKTGRLPDPAFWKGKRVLITGHTGFKGSWLAFWLSSMGAEVHGIALDPLSIPDLFSVAGIAGLLASDMRTDIRDESAVLNNLKKVKPEIVFHLAAQPLVRASYKEPSYTFTTNIQGTVSVLEAVRKINTVRAVVVITSDKVYENIEEIYSYAETDALGGYDPYSASKSCAEIVAASYRRSFFNPEFYGKNHQTLIATARAGNVIGGGDWGDDRLIPDIIRAVTEKEKVIIRNPQSVRPWQHVLEPLSGYLLLGEKLLQGHTDFADAWNFGPFRSSNIPVSEMLNISKKYWEKIDYSVAANSENPHEAGFLMLDSSKANKQLGWIPKWSIEKTLQKTLEWYKSFYEEGLIMNEKDLREYIEQI